ncbi:MAG TPA: LLM class flavin-dependent oxidoreductase [Methylomirabilota bacterium]|nr:LLM class flavin-dependent oxidoreductase [Methylomirabilota bacterium]
METERRPTSGGIEIIGMISTTLASELYGRSIIAGGVDPAFIARFARVHEEGGFDRVLVGYGSTGADGFAVTAHAAAATTRLGYLIAHRPGFVAPTLAARKAATLDHLTGGRIALHIITGGSDVEQQRDGDFLDHDARYRRTDEYLEVVRRTWASDRPFDFDGEFYRVRGAFSEVKPLQRPAIPIYFGGASGVALTVGARHCDVYALWGEPVAAIRQSIAEVRAAAPAGRAPRFSVSVRPILGATENRAWERARGILARIVELRGDAKIPARENVGSLRLLDLAARGEVHDKRLWTAIAAATGASGSTTALVGTPEQVAESLLDYYDAGATTILIRGFDPLQDAIDFGRNLIPLVRAGVAERERQAVPAAPSAVRARAE